MRGSTIKLTTPKTEAAIADKERNWAGQRSRRVLQSRTISARPRRQKFNEVMGDMSCGPARPTLSPVGVADHQKSIPRLEFNVYSAALSNPTRTAATATILAASLLPRAGAWPPAFRNHH